MSENPLKPECLPAESSPSAAESRRHNYCGWIVLIAALAVRTVYLIQFVQSPLLRYLRADQLYYLDWALRIASGDWLGSKVFEQAPLYPYLLGMAIRVFGDQPLLFLIVQLVAGAISCCLLYGSGTRLFGRPVGLIAGLLLAVYGPCIFYECMVLKSFLSPFLTTVALYGAVRYRDSENRRWLWTAGASVGLACLVRENHVLLLLPVSVFLLFASQQSERMTRVLFRRRVGAVIQLWVAAALMLVPSAARNYQVGQEFVPVTAGGGEVFYLAFGEAARPYYSAPSFVTGNPYLEHEDFRVEAERRLGRELTRAESSRYWFREAIHWATRDPARTVELTWQKAVCLFNDYEVADGEDFHVTLRFVSLLKILPTFGWIGGLGFCGAVLCCVRKAGAGGWVVPLMAASHAATVILLYNFGRFRLGMMPLSILMAAVCLVWLFDLIRETTWRSVTARVITLGIAITITYVMLQPSSVGVPRGHKAGRSLIIADLASRSGQTDLAIAELKSVLELYREFPGTHPKVVRLVSRTHLQLGLAYEAREDFENATREYRKALGLQNRHDFRIRILSVWARYLKDAIRDGRQIEDVGSCEKELQKTERELAKLMAESNAVADADQP